jgi:hypothetical protein
MLSGAAAVRVEIQRPTDMYVNTWLAHTNILSIDEDAQTKG